MNIPHTIPMRAEVNIPDTWDLNQLYQTVDAWEEDLKRLETLSEKAQEFKGRIAESREQLLSLLGFLDEVGMLSESVGQYAFLRHAGDGSDNENEKLKGKAMYILTGLSAAMSFIEPEILAIDDQVLDVWLEEKEFDPYRVSVQKMRRFKDHILSAELEEVLALQSEVGGKAQATFSALTNVDLDFGYIKTDKGNVPLTQSTYGLLLQNPETSIRKKAYLQFYRTFEAHRYTLASLYETSIKQDMFRSKVRRYKSSRERALFPDNVDPVVYDSLISSVHDALPALHDYYAMRREQLEVKKLYHWDVYTPVVQDLTVEHTYEEAVEVITRALEPLGSEYVNTLKRGLLQDRWVDRYENKGKRSGAFSSGSYKAPPYILMNYHEDVLRDVFTLAHEGGHSMHSHYSAAHNPFSSYDYTIFEAEVASTFNEQLLAHYLVHTSDDPKLKKYIIGKQLDDTVATLYRQTMFAEFEHIIHELAEKGEPVTIELLRSEYRKLLELYFGREVTLHELSDLEGLRIPHFYRAFYVYKYATGISAAMALSERVLHGGDTEREDYLSFLRSGGSSYPIDSLRKAGVDMSTPAPVASALRKFKDLLEQFNALKV
ncbi:MAG: oligoendopeptidase F [Sphaerochaetaceae bacterium]|nr:oligoendopeptidase F [Sphaerochaetaceae bacterium]